MLFLRMLVLSRTYTRSGSYPLLLPFMIISKGTDSTVSTVFTINHSTYILSWYLKVMTGELSRRRLTRVHLVTFESEWLIHVIYLGIGTLQSDAV